MLNKYQFTFILFISSVLINSIVAQNPLVNHQWSSNDENSYNTIVQGNNPFNSTSDLLETTADGGWRGFRVDHIQIDKNKSYRFSFWMKLTDVFPDTWAGNVRMEDSNGTVVSELLNSANNPSTDYYMLQTWSSPVLPNANEWYLIVGFIKANTDTNTYTSRTYDSSGNIIGENAYPNMKWNANAEFLDFSAFYKYDTATNNKSYTYDPRIQVVANGDDSINDLLMNPTNPDSTNSNNDSSSTGSSNKLNLTGLTTEQSSTYYSSVASKAIDGITAGSGSSNITHTNTAVNNWWRIDLGQVYDLARIDIYNRIDCCSDRLAGTKVYVGSVDSYTPNDYQQVGNTLTGSPAMQQLDFAATGRYILVSQHDKGSSILSLNEVEAYGALHTTTTTTTNDGGVSSSASSVWSTNGSNIYFPSGKVGIGTTNPGEYELAVNGEIRSKEVRVETANWPDYVFTKNYKLPTLKEVENHINQNGHLMNIPSAKEAESNGVELGKMDRLLLEKIEELTLYVIQLKEENDQQQEQINHQRIEIDSFKKNTNQH